MIIPDHPDVEIVKAILRSYGLYRIDIHHGVMYDSLYALVYGVVEDIENELSR